MLRFLRSHHVFMAFIVPLTGILLWMRSFLWGTTDIETIIPTAGPLSIEILQWIGNNSRILALFALVFSLISAYLADRLNGDFILVQERNQFPAFFFLLMAGSIPSLQFLHPVQLCLPFLLLAIFKVISTYRIDRLSYNPFEASVFISIASLFYLPAVIFLPAVWIGLVLFRPGYWREWLFSILGYLLPWFFYASLLFLNNGDFSENLNFFWKQIQIKPVQTFLITEKLALGFLGFFLVISSQNMIIRFQSKKIITRRAFTLFFWLFVISFFGWLLIPAAGAEMIFPASVSLCLLYSHFIVHVKKKGWAEFLFWILLILVVLMKTGR